MKLHREGFVPLIISLVLSATAIACITFFDLHVIVDAILYAAAVFIILVVLIFFRKPRRELQSSMDVVIAPADGKVVVVESVDVAEAELGSAIQISIFMSPLNVHINWAPVSGKVLYFKYHPGKYLVAWHPKSSVLNERTTVVLNQENGVKLMYRQIAGAVARRIRWYVRESDDIVQGDETGFIKFGSRVDVFVPTDAEVLVRPGDHVKGRSTVLAHL